MDMLIVTTASHRALADAYFRPTLPTDADAVVLERQLDVAGGGDFATEAWQQGVTAKLGWALDHMASMAVDDAFVLSDVDIQFFPAFTTRDLLRLLDQSGTDILFQKERTSGDSMEVNTGFYVARNRPWVRDLLGGALTMCGDMDVKNDQTAINGVLRDEDFGQRWGFLPLTYYARTQGFPPPTGIVLHHANLSGSVPEKLSQLKRVRAYVNGGAVGKAGAVVGEMWDYVTSGKLRMVLRLKLKGG